MCEAHTALYVRYIRAHHYYYYYYYYESCIQTETYHLAFYLCHVLLSDLVDLLTKI